MALNDTIVEAVANANFKSVAEMGLMNALAHQNRCNILAETAMATNLERMSTLDPTEAVGIAGVVNSDLAEIIAQLGSAVSSISQYVKGAGNTPPVTVQGVV